VALSPLTIVDLSSQPRLGFKGRETLAAMQARGVICKNQPNRAFWQTDGSLCTVLAATEVLLLGPLGGGAGALDRLEKSWHIEQSERTYPLPRRHSHAWFGLHGPGTVEMLSKICAIDFRDKTFGDLAVAQTSVARLNSIVVRADRPLGPVFHVLADSASSAYMLACLKDAAEEFGGRSGDLTSLLS
jgi:sarcosine oxidase subunit gamma